MVPWLLVVVCVVLALGPRARFASAEVNPAPLTPGTVAVVRADGDCLRLRDAPGLAGMRLTCLGEGTRVDVLDGAVEADGYRWQRIAFAGLAGWAADVYLVAADRDIPPVITPAPTPTTGSGPVSFFMPAPAGTVWRIVAGYNTATHSLADGGDPYAIDIVRDDGLTEGTAVLAPVDATVAWRDNACAVLRDGAGMRILICHFFPAAGLTIGQALTSGEPIGTVAPAGAAGNNGLPHLHLAVNEGATAARAILPLVGAYALEGRALPPITNANAYAGTIFVSTNGASGGTPIVAAPAPPPPAPAVPTLSASLPSAGFGTVLFSGGTSDELVTAAACAVERLAFWVFDGGGPVTYLPAAGVPLVNARWHALFESGIPAGTILIGRCSAS
ncbi:MAG: hypothetical protein O3B31_10935 [Chloroflexi bacterium]|nr:hypothetical protein [Chloroflexota bacterium]MDA1003841.1 hypothetical protein [Chloroflexota bacterium]